LKPHELARGAARAAGFTVHDHVFGFTAILNSEPAVLLFVLDAGVTWEIRGGSDVCRPLAQGYGLGHMLDALRGISALNIIKPVYPIVVREPECRAALAMAWL
jgi:hypothetical protein